MSKPIQNKRVVPSRGTSHRSHSNLMQLPKGLLKHKLKQNKYHVKMFVLYYNIIVPCLVITAIFITAQFCTTIPNIYNEYVQFRGKVLYCKL